MRYERGADGIYSVPPGEEALWNQFGLSRASWLVLPRAMMHQMPDDWKLRMAQLMDEFDEKVSELDIDFDVEVSGKRNGKYVSIPDWVTNYRHPRKKLIEAFR